MVIGGGVDLVTACDIRIASACAQLAVKETQIGIVADLGTLHRITRVCARSLASYMVFTGANIDARTALQGGLVSHIYDNPTIMLSEGCVRGARW
jgi:enoyl-CoA hydratase/carnithine racemase